MSRAFVDHGFEIFVEAVRGRLRRAAPVYGDTSFTRAVGINMAEILAELHDVVGWSGIVDQQARGRGWEDISMRLAELAVEAVRLEAAYRELQAEVAERERDRPGAA